MSTGRMLAIAGALVAVVAIGAGLWTIGSPAEQRALRLDRQRVQDLDRIQARILEHHALERALPADLATLSSQPGSTLPTRDPETGVPYEYLVVAPDRFRLCAVFATDTAQSRDGRGGRREHGRGRHCFDERIADDG